MPEASFSYSNNKRQYPEQIFQPWDKGPFWWWFYYCCYYCETNFYEALSGLELIMLLKRPRTPNPPAFSCQVLGLEVVVVLFVTCKAGILEQDRKRIFQLKKLLFHRKWKKGCFNQIMASLGWLDKALSELSASLLLLWL